MTKVRDDITNVDYGRLRIRNGIAVRDSNREPENELQVYECDETPENTLHSFDASEHEFHYNPSDDKLHVVARSRDKRRSRDNHVADKPRDTSNVASAANIVIPASALAKAGNAGNCTYGQDENND